MFELAIIGLSYMLTDGTLGTKVAAIAANLEIFYWIIAGIIAVIFIIGGIAINLGIGRGMIVQKILASGVIGLAAVVITVFLGLKIYLMIYIQEHLIKSATTFDGLDHEAIIGIWFWVALFVLSFLRKLFNKESEKE